MLHCVQTFKKDDLCRKKYMFVNPNVLEQWKAKDCKLELLLLTEMYLSVNIVIEPVSVGFFFLFCFFCFHLCNQRMLQQNLAIASSSNFLSLFSNTRRRSDRTNK